MIPKRILVIGYVWPEPNSSAAGSHMLSFLELFVEQGWQVTFASPAQQGEHKADLRSYGISEVTIEINSSSFDDFVQSLSPNIVLFDRFMLEEQFGWRVAKYCPDAIRILDTEDLHALRHARHHALKQARQLTSADLNSDLAKREVAAIFRCDLSLIISDYELNLLRTHYQVPPELLVHCPFMLDVAYLDQPKLSYAQRKNFISIGNFRHEPNWDAVVWLKQQIWPLIREQLPRVELHIYGAYPPPKATEIHNAKQGFLVKGWSNDAKRDLEQARVCLAPLRFGAGIKGKLAEAMLCGTPNVTTQIGIEGMHMGLDWPGLATDLSGFEDAHQSAQQIANNAVHLYQDAQFWQHCQSLGYALVLKNFDKKTLQPRLLARIADIENNLARHRDSNFIGQMLQHHQLKSTQYMAQWIEAKNSK